MTRPAKLPTWPSSGANVLEPPTAKKAAGWLPGEAPSPEYMNWLQGVANDWLTWLDVGKLDGDAQNARSETNALLAMGPAITTVDSSQLLAFAMQSFTRNSSVIVGVGYSGKIRSSSDFGATWTARTPGSSYAGDFYDVCYDYTHHVFIAVGNGEIQTSPDGTTWTRRLTGGVAMVSVRTDDSGVTIALSATHGSTFTSTNGGTSWTTNAQFSGGVFLGGGVVKNGSSWYAYGQGNENPTLTDPTTALWISADNGATWTVVNLLGSPMAAAERIIDMQLRGGVPAGGTAANGGMVALLLNISTGAYSVMCSPDGTTWTRTLVADATGSANYALAVGWFGLALVSLTPGKQGYTSKSGLTNSWILQNVLPTSINLARVQHLRNSNASTFGAALWIAAGNNSVADDRGKVSVSRLIALSP
jgi:hypothetical protein